MKKTLLLFCMLYFFQSCIKNENQPFKNLSQLTQEVISKSTIQEMKQGQSLLSVEEREELWNTKLNYILNNEKEEMTRAQLNIVTEIKRVLDSYGMRKLLSNPEIGIKFLDENLAYFSKHFSKEQLNILIESPYLKPNMNISHFTIKSMSMIAYSTEGGVCSCIYDLGCPGPNNTCDNTGCTADSNVESCGLFGTSNCKRRCTGAEPNMNI